MNELEDIYEDDVPGDSAVPAMREESKGDVDMIADDENSEDETDSEVEFVISTKAGQRAEPPTSRPQPYAAIKIQKTNPSQEVIKKEPVAKLPNVEVDAIAEMDGKSILEIDLESLDLKPWRQPGADITEYFNYGFDEFTWTAYCQKQTKLRTDYTPDKIMAGMMGPMDPGMMGPMGAGLMMPPMDPGMLQQMYGSMNMDFMQQPTGGFGSQMPLGGSNRQVPANLHGQVRDMQSPMPSSHHDLDKREENVSTGNIPKGPSQSKNNYRSRGGSSRW